VSTRSKSGLDILVLQDSSAIGIKIQRRGVEWKSVFWGNMVEWFIAAQNFHVSVVNGGDACHVWLQEVVTPYFSPSVICLFVDVLISEHRICCGGETISFQNFTLRFGEFVNNNSTLSCIITCAARMVFTSGRRTHLYSEIRGDRKLLHFQNRVYK